MELGFPDVAAEEIALVTTELATNLLKHATEGVLEVEAVEREGRRGLRIGSSDLGPGIHDVERVFADGHSTAGSLGYGLGTVNRLMDELEITSAPELERGTRISCIRWIREEARATRSLALSFGVTARPRPGDELNGDTYLIKQWGESALIAVIDGLGHGQFALRASHTARDYVERHYDAPLERIFAGANRACRGTRGAVMAIARIDVATSTLTFGSVGNIEARLMSGPERRGLAVRRGVVGLNAPRPLVKQHPWGPDAMLVMHSDGLSTSWGREELPGLARLPAPDAARRLFAQHSKPNDDAVVVVVKGGQP